MKPTSAIRLTVRTLGEVRPFWKSLALLLLVSLAVIPFSLLLPLPLKIIVDYALVDRPIGSLSGSSLILLACGLEFALLAVRGVVTYGAWLFQIRLGEQLVADGRARLFRHIQRLPIVRHDERGVVDLFYHLQTDVGSMHTIAVNGLIPLVATVLTFVMMWIVAYRLDATLAFVALGVLPVTLLLSRIHMPLSRTRWNEVKKTDQTALGVLQETLGATRVVRAFGQEEREVSRYKRRANEKLAQLTHAGLREMGYGVLVSAAVALASAIAIGLGASHVVSHALTLGNFLIISAYLVQLFRPLDAISKQTSGLQSALASAERYFVLLEESPDIVDVPAARAIHSSRGEIEFQNVSFAYGARTSVLKNVSFKIPPGSQVGIVGATGAGKTTLTSLILRFMDPTSGQILIDGKTYSSLRTKDLRRQFSLVLQEPVLFAGTIAQNIAYGRPDASPREIHAAAEMAEAATFISKLPQAYDTQIGERGLNLSGGERQRISIARAFLMNAPILVLDEPTSNLDAEHELAIKRALRKLKANRTTFTVTHRLALVDDYDVILHVEKGEVSVRSTEISKPNSFIHLNV